MEVGVSGLQPVDLLISDIFDSCEEPVSIQVCKLGHSCLQLFALVAAATVSMAVPGHQTHYYSRPMYHSRPTYYTRPRTQYYNRHRTQYYYPSTSYSHSSRYPASSYQYTYQSRPTGYHTRYQVGLLIVAEAL